VPSPADTAVADVYAAEATLDLAELLGEVPPATLALLVFTPDAVLSEQVRAGLELVAAAGFDAVAAVPVRFDRLTIREVWRHELSVDRLPDALDRLAVCDLLLPYSDSVAVLLLDRAPVAGVSSTDRLSALKGSGEPAERTAGTLRAELTSPNCVFRLVHTSDGPQELVRELGVLFPRQVRRRLLSDVNAGRPADPGRLADRIRARAGSRPLTTAPALDRLAELGPDSALLGHLRRADGAVGVRALYAAVEGLPLDRWDLVRLGARTLCPGQHDD
jgi:nucleoside diphosphate kinase